MESSDAIKLLPKCSLIDSLIEKVSKRTDCDFDYLHELEHFCRRVKQDIENIRLLFPEYTPHDDQYHLKPLFHLADKLLGKRLLQQLNATELFILACSLYGHDWGMALSVSEKQQILTSQPLSEGDSSISPDEPILFREFAQDKGYKEIKISDIPIGLWQQYVRHTHAERSSCRIRKHFEKINAGIADTVAKICRSHYLSNEELRDLDTYPIQYSVLGEVVNIRALAVYLRLIDLLDLADNRTPYTIWKYVPPRDPESVMEWDKHRVLRQVTFPSYQKGQRRILVDGNTNDHEVYAALEDLREYCENEFRACKDLLAEIPYQEYTLDLSHIDWKVKTEGFRPISIQFQFDREKMLQFMSEELYERDGRVFLRELLQNSIDAIRMRRAILEESKEGRSISYFGEIHIKAKYHENGGIDIEWKDNGIGMDESIIQNYLAMVGRCYYQSHDFQRLGLPIDPISRFGIGILTCFMVTESIEIVTKKDTNLLPISDPLRISIPDLNRRFRIEVMTDKGVDIGTTVKLFVNPRKISISSWDPSDKFPRLLITNYLRRIAGFVEFPIIIEEDTNKTVIIHPYSDRGEARKRFDDDFNIAQLDLTFPWEDAVFSQDLNLAQNIFREEMFDIQKDLALADYEGALSYLVPIEKRMDFTGGSPSEPRIKVLSSSRQNLVGRSIRLMPEWLGRIQPDRRRLKNEIEQYRRNIIYRDGILLTKASIDPPLRTRSGYDEIANTFHLVVNLPKSRAENIDFARNRVLTDSRRWANPIFDAHVQVLSDRYSKSELTTMTPAQQLFQLASFMLFHNLSIEELNQIFPRENWPLPFIDKGGKISFRLWHEIEDDSLYLTPDPLSYKLANLMSNLLKDNPPPKPLNHWQGIPSIVDFATWGGTNGDSIIINAILEFARLPFEISHRFGGVQFLSSPWQGAPPLLQEIWFPKKCFPELSKTDFENDLDRILRQPKNAILAKEEGIQKRIFELLGMKSFHPKLVIFPSPYEKSFAYGDSALNLKHPITQALVCLAARLALEKIRNYSLISQNKHFEYVLRRVLFGIPGGVGACKYDEWEILTGDLWSLIHQMGLTKTLQVDTLTSKLEEFVPGSCERWLLHAKVNERWDSPFGKVLK